ncbi:MAG TPA: hypothetical protein VLA12_08940, partial [Planctomycetaceae bacterium]|nr:hypothetical protein [Planctomycetaceae bacterium]
MRSAFSPVFFRMICAVLVGLFAALHSFPALAQENESPPTTDNTANTDTVDETTGTETQPQPGSDTSGVETLYGSVPLDEQGKPLPLSMEQTIRLVLDNNNQVRIQQLEIIKSDTDLLKDEARYAPILEAG